MLENSNSDHLKSEQKSGSNDSGEHEIKGSFSGNNHELPEEKTNHSEQENADKRFRLGKMYYFGEGVPEDYFMAAECFKEASDPGNINAQCNLGMLYFEGKGVSQDYAEAAKWFAKAARQGDKDSLLILSVMYNRGQGVLPDYKQALKLFTIAKQLNDRGTE